MPHIVVIQYAYSFELLGKAKALLPNYRNRKIETSREMEYAEIKALFILPINKVLSSVNNV